MEDFSFLGYLSGCGIAFFVLIYMGIIGLVIASLWRIFTKADKPGWAAIVPIYNIIVLLELTEQPLWMTFLYFVPVANLVVSIIVNIELANRFNRSTGFAVGLILLPIIFLPVLAFSDAGYVPSGPYKLSE